MDNIKMVDLLGQYLKIKPEIDNAIQSVLTSTAFIQGPQVSEFSNALATYTNSKCVIPCANGTDALQIAMMALGLKSGDEVIVPVHTYVATAEVIALLGLTPVFVDVDSDTFTIDCAQIESKITARTKAIVPVHLYGQCADMETIMNLANRFRLNVIEDAAQALGAKYKFKDGVVRHAGTMGTIGTTSFFPSKNLGAFGDGGAIFTQDEVLAKSIRMIANHGQREKYVHDTIGVNSRLDTLQAAILSVKLKYLDQFTASRNDVASFYDNALKACEFLETPVRSANSSHVFHQYTVKVNLKSRNQLKAFLESKGIPSMIYYPIPLHLQKAYRQSGLGEGAFPITETLSDSVLSLPIHTELSAGEMDYICSTLMSYA